MSYILGVESYGVSLTSLEQVFIKLAKEKELVMDEAPPKSISTMLRNAAGRVMRIISPGSSYLQELPSALSTPKRKSSDPSKVLPRCNNNCELDDESKSDNVTQTVPQGLSMTTNGLAPSMTTITALTDETDMESRRSCEESSFNPGQLPSKCEAAESTRDSNLSAITLPGTEVRKEKNSNFSPRDNAATSDPGSSNSWSIDISLHSGESRPSTPRYTPMSSHPKEVDGEESQDNDHLKTSETETDSEEKDDVEVLQ